jgi:hypothetical protein
MALNTNFNVFPYYDDYSDDKNFHKVLFRPAVPVQARELTQLQTILQNQVQRFGDNIYEAGTIIKGCGLSFDYNYNYVKIRDLQGDGYSVNVSDYANCYVTDSSNLKGEIVNQVQGLETQAPDLCTLYVKYSTTGDAGKKTFAVNDVLTIYQKTYPLQRINVLSGGGGYTNSDVVVITAAQGTGAIANVVTYANGVVRQVDLFTAGSGYTLGATAEITSDAGVGATLSVENFVAQVTVANNSFGNGIGTGCAVSVTDGIIYQKGHFVRVEDQVAIAGKYTNSPDQVSVGFTTLESVVNSSIDVSLLDNAQGYSNYTAPGAHRLKLTPKLVSIPTVDAGSNTDFFSVLEFEEGRVTRRKTDTQFNSVGEAMALRTSEESGDYVVRPFKVYTESANSTHLKLVVGPGTGYVKGKRVNVADVIKKPLRKATNTAVSTTQSISTNFGNFVYVKEMLGFFDFTSGNTVDLRSVAAGDVTDNFGGAPTVAGSTIGTAKIRSLVYDSGTVGTANAVYRAYLYDVKMNPAFSFNRNVKSIGNTSTGVADIVLGGYLSTAELRDTTYDQMIFSSGASSVQFFDNEQFIYRKKALVTFATSGIGQISLTDPEEWNYTPSSTLNDVQERDFIVIPTANVASSTNFTPTATSSGNTVTASADITSLISVGDYVVFSSSASYFRVTAITSSTVFTVNGTTGPAASGATFKRAYPANIPVRLDRGSANVSIDSSGKVASIYLGTGTSGSATFTVLCNVKIDGATPKTKTVNKDIFAKISNTSIAAATNGPWCLGIPDVFEIQGVYVGTGSSYADPATAANRLADFELLSGQTDNIYGLSYLRKKPGSTLSITTNTNLVVKLSCFTHGSGYYISTESYPVDDASATLPSNRIRTEQIPFYNSQRTGKYYNLRDVLDFRPMVANTVALATSAASAVAVTSNTETLTGTLIYPAPNETFQADITYYLKRIDRVVIDSSSNVRIIEGVPGNDPSPPRPPENTMTLGTVYIPPYPSLAPDTALSAARNEYSTLVKHDQVRNYTMQDIKQIEDRISRIEYYSLLNTLEQSTKDLVIPSEANSAISRFKNGFFVDPFNNYDIANPNSPEFLITIDTKNSTARPNIKKRVVDLQVNAAASSNVTTTGELALINYSHKTFIDQPAATKFRNLAQMFWKFKGSMELFPKYDNFYDTNQTSVNVTVDLASALAAQTTAINKALAAAKVTATVSSTTGNWATTSTGGGVANQARTVTSNVATTTQSIVPNGTKSEIQQVGNFVTDFGLNIYIRAQWVSFVALGLRPNSEHWVFFDKENFQSRAVPATIRDKDAFFSSGSRLGFVANETVDFSGNAGDPLITDSDGVLAGAFYIPAGSYYVGERQVTIADVYDIDDFDPAVSSAVSQFNAYNFYKDKSSVTLTTKTPESYTNISNTTFSTTTSTETRQVALPPPPAPAVCFVPGTQITMADGSKKAIELVKVGEKLIGKDGEINTVLECLPSALGERKLVSLNGSVPFMTNDHPVYMQDGTWKSVNPEGTKSRYVKLSDWNIGKLEVGDTIQTQDGTGFKITSIDEIPGDPATALHNFSLDGNHTYTAFDLIVHNKCFVAGTKVLMADKTLKNIEDVSPGEVLIGKDGNENKVLKLHRPQLGSFDHDLPHDLRLASINNGEFAVSEDHMFYTTDGWKTPTVAMCKIIHKYTLEAEGFEITQLNVGDKIVTDTGDTVTVTSIEFKNDDPNTQLYNFYLDGNRTYHVKMQGSEDVMLVHNKCFIKGTEVLLRDGTWKNIEDVDIGEELLGKEGTSNKVQEFHRPLLGVNDHWLPKPQRMVSINGSEYATSEDHMFMSNRGWVAPDAESCKLIHAETIRKEGMEITDMMVGDELITSDGSTLKVRSIDFRSDDPDLQLYNFVLSGNKTYHVRMKGIDDFTLVHNKDPLAQTFNVNTSDAADGVFITKIDLYFKSKDDVRGVTVQIRETDSGVPSPRILGKRFMSSNQIDVSSTGSIATTVVFPTPVYVKSGQEYCVVLIPDGYNPNYQLWTAELGSTDVANTAIVSNKNWGSGVLFLSSNDTVWTPYQGEDIKMTVYTAEFTKTEATLAFENEPYEFVTIANTSGAFSSREEIAQKANNYLGSMITANTSNSRILTTSSLSSSLSIGDYVMLVYANTTSAKSGTITVASTSTTVVNGTGTDFVTEYSPGDYLLCYVNSSAYFVREVVSVANTTYMNVDAPFLAAVSANTHAGLDNVMYQITSVSSVNSTSFTIKDRPTQVVSGSSGLYGAVMKVVRGTIDSTEDNNSLIIKNSSAANSSFKLEVGSLLVGEDSKATATISSIDDISVNYTETHVSDIRPPGTSIVYTQDIDAADGSSTSNTAMIDGISNKLNYLAEIKSRTNEITSGSKSYKLFAHLERSATFPSVGPGVDIIPASVVTLTNQVNNDSTNENTRYGSAQARYISKKIILSDGLDAEDLKVYVTAYKPTLSQILVYAKIASNDDTSVFEDLDWTLLKQDTDSNLYSDSLDESDYKEFQYSFKLTPPSTTLAGVATSSSNTTITGSGTSFNSSLVANDVIKVVRETETNYDVAVVDAVTNATHFTVKSNTSFSSVCSIEKVTQPQAAFKYNKESNIVSYFDKGLGRHSTYKVFAVKVVLLSSTSVYTPILKDIRALAVSV